MVILFIYIKEGVCNNMMKINILDAMREYDEEQARKAELSAETDLTANAETDPLWDCWFQLASMYEPECDKDDETAVIATGKKQPVYETESEHCKDRAKRALRRKATVMHKRKICRNVATIWQNYGERQTEDMYNWSYKKLKDGDRIIRPKSQSAKADLIFKKAYKANMVPKSMRDDIAKHLKWVSEFGKRNIAGQLYADQIERGREEKVKRELDEMAAEGVNIFNALEMNSLCKRILRDAA